MLTIIENADIRKKKQFLKKLDLDKNLWVTSDIKSEFFILNLLKKNKSDINKNTVIRAASFWSDLLTQAQPEYNLVSRAFLLPVYEEWVNCKSPQEEWQKNWETGSLVCQHIEALSHLLCHPLKEQLIEEWKSKFTDRKNKHWTKWYNLSLDFWQYLAQEKILETSWASSFLIDRIPFNYIPKKEIIFDLGFDINKVEAELICQMAKKLNITVLKPFYKSYTYIASIYEGFDQKKLTSEKSQVPVPGNLEIKKFTTTLAEVKNISVQVKKAIARGIEPNKISVLAPHIEDYWPCLKSYFKKENIPFNKTETTHLHHFPIVQLWFSKMWTYLSIFKYENLETILVHQNQGQNQYTSFSKLKSQFYNIKDISDWPLKDLKLEILKNKNELVTRDQFVEWAKKLLPSFKTEDGTLISISIRKHLEGFPPSTKSIKSLKLKWQAWLSLLEFHFKNTEITLPKSSHINGVHCLSFNALNWVDSDFIYIAGLSEQNMLTHKHNLISSLEVHSLTDDLGFHVKIEPSNKLEQVIDCFIHDQQDQHLTLSFATTNFLGTPLNPSCLWLEKALEHQKNTHQFDNLELTSWDKQQRKSTVKEILSLTEDSLSEQSIKEDIGHKTPPLFFEGQIKKLSASSLDLYVKCPFIFTAKKIFHLWDGPERDMDIPAMDRGNMLHKLFEILKNKKLDLEEVKSRETILKIIGEIKFNSDFKKEMRKIHPIIWEREKNILLKKTLRFLEHEKERKLLFKNYQTIACEKEYSCYWDLKNKSLAKKGDILLKGKIDRIDSDSKSYQIIDYKNSLPTGSTVTSWASQSNFQMAFYMQVLEKGLCNLPTLPVKSALYLSYKNFTYQGLAIKDPAYIELLGSPRKRSLITEEQKEAILKSVNNKINSTISNIYIGKLHAKPRSKTTCKTCRWNRICRARHLN